MWACVWESVSASLLRTGPAVVGSGGPGQVWASAPQAATPPTGRKRAAARVPLGPGGGRSLSPGRASEHVQSRCPLARRPPASPPARRPLGARWLRRRAQRRGPSAAPASPAAAPSAGPRQAARRGPRTARGRAGAGALGSGTAGLRARRPGAARAWPPERAPQPAAIAGESCPPGARPGHPHGLRAGFPPVGPANKFV